MSRFWALLMVFAAVPAWGQAQTAVLPVLGYGVPSDRIEQLEGALFLAVDAAAGGGLLGKDETSLLLEAAEATIPCVRSELSCLVELGALMAVNRLVLAKAEQGPEGLSITLDVVDVSEAREIRRVSAPLTGTQVEQTRQLRQIVFQLFHDSAAVLGGLIINVHEEGATVFVDDTVKGVTPLKGPVFGLEQGEHVVRVELEGAEPITRTVHVDGSAVVQMALRVVPEPQEARDGVGYARLRTFGWSVVGVGTGTLLLGAVAAATGATLTVLTWALIEGSFAVGVLAFIAHVYGCYTLDQTSAVGCDPGALAESRKIYDDVSWRTQIAAAIGIPGTVVAALSVGAIGAGAGLLLFARYSELVQTGELDLVPDDKPELSARVVASVQRSRSGL